MPFKLLMICLALGMESYSSSSALSPPHQYVSTLLLFFNTNRRNTYTIRGLASPTFISHPAHTADFKLLTQMQLTTKLSLSVIFVTKIAFLFINTSLPLPLTQLLVALLKADWRRGRNVLENVLFAYKSILLYSETHFQREGGCFSRIMRR